MRVLPVYLVAAVLILFVAGVLRDPRSFSNAVLLGSGLALAALGAAHWLAETTGPMARLLALALGLLVAFGPVLVASYLVLNGITMVRRESIRPANLLRDCGWHFQLLPAIGNAAYQMANRDKVVLS